MATTVTVEQAGADLSKLIDRAQEGEEVIIEREGKEVARLVASGTAQKKDSSRVDGRESPIGWAKGLMWISDDFNDSMPEWEEWLEDPKNPINWPSKSR